MELNNPVKSRIYIIMIVILSLTGMISLFINVVLKKNNIIESINLKEVIIKNEELNEYLNNKRIPIKVLSYLDDSSINKLSIDIVNKLYKGEDKLIKKESIIDLIKSSINKYETLENEDIYPNIWKDIEKASESIANTINNKENINRYNIIKDTAYIGFIPIAFTISFAILLTLSEKKKSLLITGAILIGVSLVFKYISKSLLQVLYNNIDILNILRINLDKSSDNISSIISGIILSVGLILSLVYIFIEGRHAYRRLRTSYLDKYY